MPTDVTDQFSLEENKWVQSIRSIGKELSERSCTPKRYSNEVQALLIKADNAVGKVMEVLDREYEGDE